MTPADMAAIHAAAFTDSRPWSTDEFAQLLDTKGTFAAGDARCFALVRVIADEAELLTLATHPAHQRCGLADRLMPVWQHMACARAARAAFLEVAADNAPARALYAKHGFSEIGRRPGYYARPGGSAVDAVMLKRDIDKA